MRDYPEQAIGRARDGALEWLEKNLHGYPRSRAQEDAITEQRGRDMYDQFEAPPILGYEVLEREGLVIRRDPIHESNEERIHFELKR